MKTPISHMMVVSSPNVDNCGFLPRHEDLYGFGDEVLVEPDFSLIHVPVTPATLKEFTKRNKKYDVEFFTQIN